MRLLLDMNLSPTWTSILGAEGWDAAHWSTVGNPKAPDREIMLWAATNDYIVVTHDLDFGALLAITLAPGPSVLQIRTQNISPHQAGSLLINALKQFETLLQAGALIVVEESRSRARVLPLTPQQP